MHVFLYFLFYCSPWEDTLDSDCILLFADMKKIFKELELETAFLQAVDITVSNVIHRQGGKGNRGRIRDY